MKIYVDLDHVDITEYTQIESGEYNTNKINFIFTPEYKDLVKVAIFGSQLDTDEPKFYKIYLSDDSCYVPSEVVATPDVISIGVYAFNVENGELKLRYSPTPVKTIVYEGSFREEAENSSSPTPTEIEQIMSRIISLEELTSDLDTRVEALESKACDLDSIKEDVETLKSDVENISGRVDTIESDIDDLEGDIANTYSKTEVDTLLGAKVDTSTYNSGQATQDEKIAKVELILSQWPKVTGEGNNISLSPTLKGKLEVERLSGDTIQDGTPTPDTPVDIQVVTGTQEVEVVGKNIYIPTLTSDNVTILQQRCNVTINEDEYIITATGTDFYWGNITSEGQAYNGGKGIRIYTKGNEKISFWISNTNIKTNFITPYNENGIAGRYTQINSNQGTYTVPSGTSFISFRFGDNASVSGNVYKTKIMVCYGDTIPTATTYSPYTSQTYTLHLGDLELAKIPNTTYIDKIFIAEEGNEVYDSLTQEQKANLTLGKWYKYGAIGKYTLTGNETFVTSSSTSSRTYYGVDYSENGIYQYSDQTSLPDFLCEKFTRRTQAGSFVPGQVSLLVSSKYVDFIFNPDTTEQQARTILTGMKSYFRLANASTTEITNETLLSDLEYIRTHAMSYSGTTNISSSGNLPIIITASALKQLS